MPNIDGGHYFLTSFAPIRTDPMTGADGVLVSPVASLRALLATLPSGAHNGGDDDCTEASPFARCRRTHLARFVIVDQPAFNGRDPGNAIIQSIRKTDLLVAQPVDMMSCSWLLFACDFDAREGDPDGGLGGYLAGLWAVMGEELGAIYSHCHGFDRRGDATGFAHYVERCQIETTMPFNDYWTTPPPLPSISMPLIGVVTAAIGLVLGWGVVRLTGIPHAWLWATIPIGLAAALYGAFRYITARGLRPFPTAPDSDLPSVLKSLYLQQNFARFAAASQTLDPSALHAAFGAFLAGHRPTDLGAPTQAPETIRS